MPMDYLIYSEVSLQAPSPVMLCVSLTPPDAPTGGVAQSEYFSSSWEQVWSLLPVLNSNWFVLQHKLSGFALRFGAQDAQLTVEPYLPFDRSVLMTYSGSPGWVHIFNVGSPNLMVTIAGSNYTPPAPVNGSPDNAAQGQRWMLVPYVSPTGVGSAPKSGRR